MANLKRIARSTGVYTNGLARQMKTALFVIMFLRQSTRNVNSDFFCCAKTKAIGSQFSQTMDAIHIAKVLRARDRVERWPCTLLFDMSEAGDETNVVNLLRFVAIPTAPPPFPSNAAPPPFPSRYDTRSKEGMELLRRDLSKVSLWTRSSSRWITRVLSRDKNGDGRTVHLLRSRVSVGAPI